MPRPLFPVFWLGKRPKHTKKQSGHETKVNLHTMHNYLLKIEATVHCSIRCMCVPLWGSKANWSGYQPADWGSFPTQDTLVLLFPWARKFTHIAPLYPAVKWRPSVNYGNSPPSCTHQLIPGNYNCLCLVWQCEVCGFQDCYLWDLDSLPVGY